MKNKSTQTILICIAVGLLLCNIVLMYSYQQTKSRLDKAVQVINQLEDLNDDTEFRFMIYKEVSVSRYRYEQYSLRNTQIYTGSDRNALQPTGLIAERSKLVLGLSQNMCSSCILEVLNALKEFFPSYETNTNILCIADIEQRFKDDYYGKKVISFHRREDYPLYEIDRPYFFILDKDLSVKMLFITDNTGPEMTQEYLKIIRERYPEI